jgi:tripartite-type tricarboxylate transporter receptor subunit TctC
MKRLLVALGVLFLAAVFPAMAGYPERPIRMLIGVPPGGASDAAARLIAQSLSRFLGQPVIVENRPGAGGAIAASVAHGAAPDGYTLLWAMSSMAGLPMLLKSSPFNSLAEFTPISITCRLPAGLYVHPSVPASSVAQLVAYVRANPDKLNYATGPLSEYMSAVQFMKATNTSMVRIAYKGGAPALIDLVEGRVQVYFTPLSQALPQARAGKLKMLATMMPVRIAEAPDVPTFAEMGLGEISVPNWNALVAPPKTPAAIADRLSREIAKAVADPVLRSALSSQYLVPDSSTPAELSEAMAKANDVWRRFIAENNIPRE